MTPKAYLSHQIPSRARLYVPSCRGAPEFFEEIKRKLGECDAVESVQTNPRTGGVLIRHEGDFEEVARFAKDHDLFEVKKERSPAEKGELWTKSVISKLEHWDECLKSSSRGKWDLSALTAVTFAGLGVVQIARGEYLPPAWTLFRDAFAVLSEGVEEFEKSSDIKLERIGAKLRRRV